MYGYAGVSSGDSWMKSHNIDLESVKMLYPGIGYGENQLRWGFIRKFYDILTAQIFLTTAVFDATVYTRQLTIFSVEIPPSCFFSSSPLRLLLFRKTEIISVTVA